MKNIFASIPSAGTSAVPAGLSRRNILTLAGILGGSAALAACGGPSTAGTGGAVETAGTDWGSITPADRITWWSNHPGASKPIEEELIRRFTAETGIEVDLVTAGANYDEVAQRFQASAGTNNVPDLVGASDVWWFRYMINGQILPVDDVAAHLGIDTADYNTGLYNDYEFNGSHWAFPYARSTPLFYYNRTLFKAAGLPDRAPKTWDEYNSWAPDLAAANGGAVPMALGSDTSWSAWWFCNIMWGLGGQYSKEWTLTLDDPKTLEAGEFLRRMIHRDQTVAVSAADYVADFTAGVSSCTIASTGSLSGILEAAKFDVGTGFLPEGPAGPGCPTGGTGIAIAAEKSPEQQLAAAMFLQFIGEPEQTAYFSANTGYMPVRTSAADSAEMQAVYAKAPQFRTAVDQLATTRVQDWARSFVPSGDQHLTTALEKIMLQDTPAADAFAAASDAIAKSFEQNVEPYL